MDHRLRELRRAAQAAPFDRAAGASFARALEQAGDAAGAWRERCRLARAGDLEAWDEVHRRPVGFACAPTVLARRTLALEGVDLLEATGPDDTLVVWTAAGLLGLAPDDLATRWHLRLTSVVRPVRCGPGIGAIDGDTRELVLVDGATGVTRGRVAIGGQRVSHLIECLGRVTVWLADESARPGDAWWRVDLDASDPTHPPSPPASRTPYAFSGPRWPTGPIADTVLWDSLPRASIEAVGPAGSAWRTDGSILATDRRGVLVGDCHEDGWLRGLSQRDLETGAVRWSDAGAHLRPGTVLTTPGLALFLGDSERALRWHPRHADLEVVAIERADGRVRWRHVERLGRHAVCATALGAGQLHVVVERARSARRPTETRALALDLETGAVVGSWALDVDSASRRVALAAVDGGAVVLWTDRQETTLVRLG